LFVVVLIRWLFLVILLLIAALKLILISFDNCLMEHFTALAGDRVGDISIELDPTPVVGCCMWGSQAGSTVIAVFRAKMIFVFASWAAEIQFAAGHGYEESVGPADDLDVPYDITLVDTNTGKST
jgi:hypothetical protein